MTATLTKDQLSVVNHSEQRNEPAVFIDPDTRREYVLVSTDDFERVRTLLEDLHPRDTYAAVDRAFAEGWSDPKMADYDRYDELKHPAELSVPHGQRPVRRT